jgi:hypothetical protein
MIREPLVRQLLHRSRGVDGRECLPRSVREWARGLNCLPTSYWVHFDEPSQRAATLLGCAAFTLDNHVYLGAVPPHLVDSVLRHELTHISQVALARKRGRVSPSRAVEQEAERLASLPVASPVRCPAHPDRPHPVVWFVAIGVGLYVLLRPGVANAPGPQTRTQPSPSTAQIVGEALAIFAVPGGAMSLGGRLGLGFLGKMALAGASANVCLRGVDDVARGEASPPLLYLFDATTGAVIGYIVPGGFRLIGRAGTFGLDRLATYGLSRSEIMIANTLAEEAALAPLNAARAQQILQSQRLSGQVSAWWLNRRGMILLYRGQGQATTELLSPLARQQGVAASEAMVARMRAIGLSDSEIAGYTARWHTEPVPPFAAPPELAYQPLGSVGIPATRLPGIAANFGEEGVIYVIRMPKSAAISPMGWQGLQLESEYIILNRVPPQSIVEAIPANRVAPIMVNEQGLLVPGVGR